MIKVLDCFRCVKIGIFLVDLGLELGAIIFIEIFNLIKFDDKP